MSKMCTNSKCFKYKDGVLAGQFCAGCGLKLIDMPVCKYCKTEIWPTTNFCTECGKPNK